MREERKLHHAVESSGGERYGRRRDGGEESCRWERKLHHAEEIAAEELDGGEESCRWRSRIGSCIAQWRAEERWRRAADEGGEEAASRSGDQRRAAEELDGGEKRWRRGELQMRDEDRELHRAVEIAAEELDGGEESCRRGRTGSCITQWRSEEESSRGVRWRREEMEERRAADEGRG